MSRYRTIVMTHTFWAVHWNIIKVYINSMCHRNTTGPPSLEAFILLIEGQLTALWQLKWCFNYLLLIKANFNGLFSRKLIKDSMWYRTLSSLIILTIIAGAQGKKFETRNLAGTVAISICLRKINQNNFSSCKDRKRYYACKWNHSYIRKNAICHSKKELLVNIKWSFSLFRSYMNGRPFVIGTDHHDLK